MPTKHRPLRAKFYRDLFGEGRDGTDATTLQEGEDTTKWWLGRALGVAIGGGSIVAYAGRSEMARSWAAHAMGVINQYLQIFK